MDAGDLVAVRLYGEVASLEEDDGVLGVQVVLRAGARPEFVEVVTLGSAHFPGTYGIRWGQEGGENNCNHYNEGEPLHDLPPLVTRKEVSAHSLASSMARLNPA